MQRHTFMQTKSHVEQLGGYEATVIDDQRVQVIRTEDAERKVSWLEELGYTGTVHGDGSIRFAKPGSDWTFLISNLYAPETN